MSNAKLQLSRTLSTKLDVKAPQLSIPVPRDSKAHVLQTKAPPPPPPPSISSKHDSDLDLTDDFNELTTCTPTHSKSASSSSATAALVSALRGSSGVDAASALLKMFNNSYNLYPSTWTYKEYMTTINEGVPLITGTTNPVFDIAQGDGINKRQGDNAYLHGLELIWETTYFPYSTGAIAQQLANPAAVLDTIWVTVSNDKLPAVAGTNGFTMTWSAANPPTTSSGTLISFSAQNTQAGNIFMVNPNHSFEIDIYRHFSHPLVRHNSDPLLYGAFSTQGSATVVGTLGPRTLSKKMYIHIGKRVQFDAATSNAILNMFGITYYGKFTQAQRHNGGYDCLISYRVRALFKDTNS